MNLAGYIRVSSDVQVDAYGKETQKESIQRWADLLGHTVTVWFEEDGVSGKVEGADRPVLAAILERADEFDGVVAFDATRLARRLYLQETLLNLIWATGLTVFTTTAGELEADEDDPTKILIRQVIGAVAEFDHRSIVKKLHAARKMKSAEGGYIGGTPKFGMRVEGSGKASRFVHDPEECRIITEIESRYRSGEGLRQIAASLNRRGIPSKTGKKWYASGIQRIIQRQENT